MKQLYDIYNLLLPYGFVLEYIAFLMIFYGCFLMLTAAIGIVRMPDVFNKCHVVSIVDSASAMSIIGGCCILSGFSVITIKLVVIMIMIVIFTPFSTYALTQAALKGGINPYKINIEKANHDAKYN